MDVSEDGNVFTRINEHTLDVYTKTNESDQTTSINLLDGYNRISYSLQGDVCTSRIFNYHDDSTLLNTRIHL